MKSRRQILEALGACVLIAPLAAIAQSNKVYRVGWISLGQSNAPSPYLDAFRQGLKERGYIEGKNLVLDARLADGSRERADQMVAALVRSKVDIIVTQGGAAWSAYRHAETTPVVIGYSGDPVEAKFVKSLAQPGGTLTGMSFLALELVGKRLELLAQILSPGSRVAVIADPEHPGEQTELRESRVAAQNIGMKLSYFPVRTPEELDAAFKTISSETTQGIVVFPDAFTLDQRVRIATFGLKYRLPIVSGWREYAESGFLMTYGPNLRDSYAHLAVYVDKILRGARPADLPVELPTSVQFVVNARTAKALGLTIPKELLLRADEVIQ
jgi:putative ABC transport system substrate-binding protein